MEREILFRGIPVNQNLFKIIDDKEVPCFIEGGFYRDYCYGGCPEGEDYIISYNSTGFGFNDFTLCIKETIEQFTGLRDKDGVKIFEGDIIKRIDSDTKFIVVFNGGSFCVQDSENLHHNLGLLDSISNYSTIVGNIHQNKELIL